MKGRTATQATSTRVYVPAVCGDVEVRRIPPKLLREIRAKATTGGNFDAYELMVWKLAYGLKSPSFTTAEIRALMECWTLGALQSIVDRIDEISGTDEHLHGVDDGVPPRLRWYAEQMVMASSWLRRFPDAPSRVPRTARARGAGRPAARRSTTPSRDGPGDDSDSSEPPPAGRLCGCGCRASIAHKAPQARYLNDTHAAAERQRRKRARDQAPALTDVGLAPVRCACWPQHNVVEHGHCVKCGHALGFEFAEWIHGPAPGSRQLVVYGSTPRGPRYGDRRRRPPSERFDPSSRPGWPRDRPQRRSSGTREGPTGSRRSPTGRYSPAVGCCSTSRPGCALLKDLIAAMINSSRSTSRSGQHERRMPAL